MERFIGRQEELDALENLYRKDGFQMAIIYGRRRVGKSTLISHFIQNKRSIYYTATRFGNERNLALLGRQVIDALAPNIGNVTFPSLDDLLTFITRYLPREKTVFVIDELPYWVDKEEGLLSVFQKYIDTAWPSANLLLILCGSALSFMQNKVLSEKSPLFGRRSIQLYLKPFHYKESALFVPEYSFEDKALVHGITGGIPQYLSLIDPDLSLDENIKALFFSKTGYFYDETRNLLVQEFDDIAVVNAIIEQIASGENTVSLIADKIHEKSQTVLYTLGKLISVGLVEKKHCITEEKNKKKTKYELKDTMFRFWYMFIPEAASLIELNRGALYYDRFVRPRLHSFMGSVFEEMCRSFTLEKGADGAYGCFLTQTGSWWGTEILKDEQGKPIYQTADIDVVGLAPFEKSFIVGECKFRNDKLDRSVYDLLVRRSHAVPTSYRVVQYLLFSLGGFTDWFAKEKPALVSLYTLEDLYTK